MVLWTFFGFLIGFVPSFMGGMFAGIHVSRDRELILPLGVLLGIAGGAAAAIGIFLTMSAPPWGGGH